MFGLYTDVHLKQFEKKQKFKKRLGSHSNTLIPILSPNLISGNHALYTPKSREWWA